MVNSFTEVGRELGEIHTVEAIRWNVAGFVVFGDFCIVFEFQDYAQAGCRTLEWGVCLVGFTSGLLVPSPRWIFGDRIPKGNGNRPYGGSA